MRSYNGAPDVCALILCAGKGARTGLPYNKILYTLGKKTLLETVLDAFSQSCVTRCIVVANPDDRAEVEEIAAAYKNTSVTKGGDTRTQSVRNGLRAAQGCDVVAIHDGARPFVSPALIDATVQSALAYGSGVAAVPATDTIKTAENGVITRSLPREKLWCMQTPQTFVYTQLCEAYEKATGTYTDDAEAYALAGFTPRIVTGAYDNIKITTPTDLMRGAPARVKIGVGFDVHPLTTGRALVLGGVTIPHDKGLDGHSDGDVLTHAIMDALLSAAGLPDIGVLFPDTDPKTEGICSLLLLDEVCKRVRACGYEIGNVSAVVAAQKPKLMPHIAAIRKTLADRMGIRTEQVDVSATTTERLGIVGEEKGMAAHASCILSEEK